MLTASDTRTPEDDASGSLIRELIEAAGHRVTYYEIVPDVCERLARAVTGHLPEFDALIVTGGSGIAPRDCTVEAIRPLFDKELPGFGELFRMLSYQEIGSPAFLSRASAGIRGGKLIVLLPGATAGCRLAMEKLILPEIGHIAYLLDVGGQ